MAEMKTFRVWVSGYADIPAWTKAHAEDIASKLITISDGKIFVCVSGPTAYSTTEESPR